MSKESDDHSLMHRLSEELDVECDALSVQRLSAFADFTDLELCMNEDDDDDSDLEPVLDEETGYSYGIDDMQWYAISPGLACLETLRKHVADGWNPDLDEDERAVLVEEFDDCIAKLRAVPTETGKFHLAVIM